MNRLICPNCGRIYNRNEMKYYCGNCNYKLLAEDQVTDFNKLQKETDNRIEYHTIGHTQSSKPTVSCPYCHSTNATKISTTSKVVNTALFGIFGQKRKHQWHCNNCKSDF